MSKTATIQTHRTPAVPKCSNATVTSVIHFVDVGSIGTELRPVCGAWGEHVTWTTLRSVMTCPACARLLRVARPERRAGQAAADKPSGR